MKPNDLDLDDAIDLALSRGWLVERVSGFGDDEQPCAYCEDKPGTHDPVLGYSCAGCRKAIEEGE